mmetsp:Transcript_11221/g.14566  ORF Transcript_11221/g.14566 Transcript_11221/m.14566 type:complete len:420 (-) Transcript_11221:3-1262(-)
MSERGFRIKTDINKEGWENAEFPVACETCLGDNPYVRMTKEPYGKSCKICERPYTAFRWRPGQTSRYKGTQLCQTCAKLKNVCQVCVLDLQYGLPVEVRDKYLTDEERLVVPESDANREWFAGQHSAMIDNAGAGGYGAAPRHQTLLRLARNQPYYRRNLPHKCSFYAKGECSRGEKCPFLHEMPTPKEDPLATQNIKDRFYGKDDPVAAKLLGRASSLPALQTPEDKSITSLWIGNMDDSISQQDLKDVFYQYGELASIRMIPRQRCAFVEFTLRDAAERAAQTLYNCLYIKGFRLRLTWATRPKEPALPSPVPMPPPPVPVPGAASQPSAEGTGEVVPAPPALPAAPMYIPPPPGIEKLQAPPLPQAGTTAPPPPPPLSVGAATAYQSMYPSMNPQRMGATPQEPTQTPTPTQTTQA